MYIKGNLERVLKRVWIEVDERREEKGWMLGGFYYKNRGRRSYRRW